MVGRWGEFWMRCAVGSSLLVLNAPTAVADISNEGAELIGTAAKEWGPCNWLNSAPLSLDQLRGRVVLVRWWTGPECQYCAASAPILNAWYNTYRASGLVIIGFYHHKSSTPISPDHVRQLVERYGFQFPVAIDPQWQTLKRWWLNRHDRPWTSVSFLIDQEGLIRYVHPGGSYTAEEVKAIEAVIQNLLEHPPRPARASSTQETPRP